MDQKMVTQMVKVLNGLTARDALCLLIDCMLTDGCIDLLVSGHHCNRQSPPVPKPSA
jgi:hypothetical protein